jgi:hypothetical protein
METANDENYLFTNFIRPVTPQAGTKTSGGVITTFPNYAGAGRNSTAIDSPTAGVRNLEVFANADTSAGLVCIEFEWKDSKSSKSSKSDKSDKSDKSSKSDKRKKKRFLRRYPETQADRL